MSKRAVVTNLQAVDPSTGQLVELTTRHIKFPHPFGEAWFQQSQSALAEVAKDKEMTLVGHRVLALLLSALDFKNFILVPQSAIAKELKLDPSQVSKAMKLLVEKGWIYEGDPVGQVKTYRLNERFAFKGDVRDFKALTSERQRRTKKLISDSSMLIDDKTLSLLPDEDAPQA